MHTTQTRHKRKGGVGSTLALLLLGALLLTGVAMYCYTQLLPNIESDLTERVTAQLVNKGITTALVSVDGTDVTLTGNVETDPSALEAEQLALAVYGVTSVQNNLNKNTGRSGNSNINAKDSKTTDIALNENAVAAVNSTVGKAVNNTDGNADTAGNSQTTTNAQTTAANNAEAPIVQSSLEVIVSDSKALINGVLPDTSMAQRIAAAVAVEYGHDNVENNITIVPDAPAPLLSLIHI